MNDRLRLETADNVHALRDRLLAGVDVPGHVDGGGCAGDDDMAGRVLRDTEGLDPVPRALARMLAFFMHGPYPPVSHLVGRMLYACTLRTEGLAALSYLPVATFLHDWRAQSFTRPGYRPSRTFAQAIWDAGSTRDWSAFFEETLGYLEDEAGWFVRKLGWMRLRRERLEALFARDERYDVRQHDVLVEALVHDDAEFSFDDLTARYEIAYSTAHEDLVRLAEDGFLHQVRQGKRLWFIAAPDIFGRVHAYLRAIDPELYARSFGEDGRLLVDGKDDEDLERPFAPQDAARLPHVLPMRRKALLREPRLGRG